MRVIYFLVAFLMISQASAETKSVFLEDNEGARIEIAQLTFSENGEYQVEMQEASFAEHFLSMRPFKCLEGPNKHWCHVPYPYEIARNIETELVDLEYDFLFLWKGSTEYGINMWNGVYYKLEERDGKVTGLLHEMDMNLLAAPPDAGVLRPLSEKDLHESDPEGHWLPRLVIE